MVYSVQHTTAKMPFWRSLHRFGSPAYFYHFAERWAGLNRLLALVLLIAGLYLGLVVAPPDYQMGDHYRIIFIHAPAAWMSLFAYVVLAFSAGCGLIWRMKVGAAAARAAAHLGALFTFCTLVTGALWGKPTWGTYWIWDARLTSELLLLFLYIGYLALISAFNDRRTAAKAGALWAIVGLVNLPVIHYSVEWWNTLHQGATIVGFNRPSMDVRMLIPLLTMFAAFNFYFIAALLHRTRVELLSSERRSRWVRQIVQARLAPVDAHRQRR